jgi:hypothetical protein
MIAVVRWRHRHEHAFVQGCSGARRTCSADRRSLARELFVEHATQSMIVRAA